MPVTPPSTGLVSGFVQIPSDAAGVAPLVVTPADALTKAALAAFASLGVPLVFNGTTFDLPRTASKIVPIALTAGTTETTAYTPSSGKKWRVLAATLTVSAQSILTWKDNTGGTTRFVLEPAANSPLQISFGALGILSAAADNVLTVTRATSCTLNGFLLVTEE